MKERYLIKIFAIRIFGGSLVRCFGLESTPLVGDVHGQSIDGWAVQGDDR